MRIRLVAALTLLAFMTPGCGLLSRISFKKATPEPIPTPPSLISKLGVSTPFEKAVRGISFRPFVPSRQLVDVALIAPLRAKDDDNRHNRGIAFEYAASGHAMALSEWPLHGDHFSAGVAEIGGTPCEIAPFKADGVRWTTRGDLLMTLQADGKIKPSRVQAEARRLLQRGACG